MDGGQPPLWATLLTGWGATWSACWSWGWSAPAVAQPAPTSSFGYCEGETGRCSCDAELRRVIDLQEEVRHLQAEVWTLRCLLLAGLLLLGVVASGAGTLGFLVGACRRCRGARRERAPEPVADGRGPPAAASAVAPGADAPGPALGRGPLTPSRRQL